MAVSETVQEITIDATVAETVRVALTFDNLATSSCQSLANFDLRVYDNNGMLRGESVKTNNNVEIVEFTATYTGNYTVRISKVSNAMYNGTTAVPIIFAVSWISELEVPQD